MRNVVLGVSALMVGWAFGCGPGEQEKFRALSQEINRLKVEKIDLEESLLARDARIESLTGQIENLRVRDGAPSPMFETDRIDLLDITSGVDLDDRPGDDGVAVYFRPVDRDGHVLKRGGRIAVKLLDHSASDRARQVGQVALNDGDAIKRAWYGRFWTDHYKVIVPFSADFTPRPGQKLGVWVEFIEITSGRPFTAFKTIQVRAIGGGKSDGG